MVKADKRILVAEDDGDLRKMLVTVIEDENYQVEEAVDGFDAWEMLQKSRYDLLVTDLFMPQIDGVELISKIQQNFPATKCVLLSGGGREVNIDLDQRRVEYRDRIVTVDRYLKKPFKLKKLLSVLENLLEE